MPIGMGDWKLQTQVGGGTKITSLFRSIEQTGYELLSVKVLKWYQQHIFS